MAKKKIRIILTFIFLFLLIPQNIITAESNNKKQIPEHINGVFDEGNFLNENVKSFVSELNNELSLTEEEFQIAVIALKSLENETIEQFSNRVAREWKVGTKTNNGILFVFSVEDRKSRLEVSNKASIVLTDGEANLYLDLIKNDFRKEKYSEGTLKLLKALKDEKFLIEKNNKKESRKKHRHSDEQSPEMVIAFLITGYIFFVIIRLQDSKYKSKKLTSAILETTLDFIMLVASRRSSSRDSDDDDGPNWSGGGFGGGGSSSGW